MHPAQRARTASLSCKHLGVMYQQPCKGHRSVMTVYRQPYFSSLLSSVNQLHILNTQTNQNFSVIQFLKVPCRLIKK
jgi:hypothetical protein